MIRDRSAGALLLLALVTGCDAKTRDFFAPPLDASGGARSGVIGTVTLDGQGLAGVSVVLTPTGRSTATGPAGGYAFGPLPPGDYEVRLINLPPGIVCVGEPWVASVASDGLARVDIECFTAASIVGVATLDGEPLDGLPLSLSGDRDLEATTDAEGEFGFGDLPPGSYVVTPAPPPGVVCVPASAAIVLGAGESTMIVFVCTVLGAIEGTVTLDGAPFSGISVALSGSSSASTTADAAGAYAFSGVPAGDATVSLAGVPGGVTCTPTQHDVTVTAGAVVRADFACATDAAAEPLGSFDIVYIPFSNSCGTPDLSPETGSIAPIGSDIAISIPHTPFPIVGPYDGGSGAFLGTTGWQDATGELAFEVAIEKRESWDVIFEPGPGGTTTFAGTVRIEYRETASGAPVCEVEMLVQGSGGS